MQKFGLLFLVAIPLLAGGARAQDATLEAGTAVITSPTDGQQVFGLLEIIGTASHPSAFDGYALEWSNAQNPDVWLPIQPPLSQAVNDGILGQWDTVAAGIPDGVYQIRLRMFLIDGTFQDFEVKNLVVVNSTPTGIPTAAVAPPTPSLPLLPTAGASPTSLILQPPTVTPRPTFEQPLGSASSDGSTRSDENTFINFNAVQSAVCNGVYFTFGLFGIILVYLLLRRQISPYTRRLWWQIRSEIENDRRDF